MAENINQTNPEENLPPKPKGPTAGEKLANRISGAHDTVRMADRLSGGKISQKAGEFGQNFDKSKLGKTVGKVGENVNKVKGVVDAGKKKIADTATKPIKEIGKKAAAKGAELAAKAGVSAAAGAATGGLSTAAQAGIEAGKKAAEVSEKARQSIKRATGDLVDIDILGEIKDRIKRSWKKGKWKMVGGCCLLLAILLILPIIIFVAIIGNFFAFDTNDSSNKAIVQNIDSMEASGKISFVDNQDLNQIKRGEIGISSLKLMNYLAKNHDKIVINYNPKSTSGNSSTVIGDNERYEFDIVAVDEIKCTSSSGGKQITIPINLSSLYNWAQHSTNIISGDYLCASGYYPKTQTALNGTYAANFGPGEFPLEAIGTYGPMAAQEKLAEITADILDGNSRLGVAADSEGSILPAQIEIDKVYSGPSLKNKSVTVLSELKNKIDAAYPAIESTARQGVIPANKKYGVHVSFLD